MKHGPNRLAGISWMVVTGLLFVAVTCIVRHLGSDLPAVQAAFIRYAVGLLLIIPLAWKIRLRLPSRRVWKLYVARGACHGIAVILWFFSMARIPIADVTAIGYLAPVFTTVGAVLFLNEEFRIHRVIAVIVGVLGALIILRPGFEVIEIGAIAQLIACPLFAASFLLAKRLTDSEHATDILVMLSLFCTLVLLPGAVYNWRTPTPTEFGWLALTAVFASLGHYTLTRAFAVAPISLTQPISFLQLVWATLLGIWLFAEPVDFWLLVGGGLIVAAVTYMSRKEMDSN